MSDDTQYLPPDPDVPRYQGRPVHDQTRPLPPVPAEDPPTTRPPDPYTERDAQRRRDSLLLVGVAAVVCLVGAVLALNGLTGGDGSDGSGSQAGGQGAATPAELVLFQSPSGNIGCSLSGEGARCDIAEKTWQPPAAPGDCKGDWGAGVQVGPGGAGLVCATDTVLGEGEPLPYGETISRGDFTCASSRDGMRCENATGQGFTIARAAYRTF